MVPYLTSVITNAALPAADQLNIRRLSRFYFSVPMRYRRCTDMTWQGIIRRRTDCWLCLLSVTKGTSAAITWSPRSALFGRQAGKVGLDTCGYWSVTVSTSTCKHYYRSQNKKEKIRTARLTGSVGGPVTCPAGSPCITTAVGDAISIYCSNPFSSYDSTAYNWNEWPQTPCQPNVKCW